MRATFASPAVMLRVMMFEYAYVGRDREATATLVSTMSVAAVERIEARELERDRDVDGEYDEERYEDCRDYVHRADGFHQLKPLFISHTSCLFEKL